jgi:hypothetical protein
VVEKVEAQPAVDSGIPEAEAAAEASAAAEAPQEAASPSHDDHTVRDGGARAPGLDRNGCQSLVGAAAPARTLTSMGPETAKFLVSGVQREPGRPGIFATKSAALGGFWILLRSSRRGSASSEALQELISGISYRKRQDVSSSDRLLFGKRMSGRELFRMYQLLKY